MANYVVHLINLNAIVKKEVIQVKQRIKKPTTKEKSRTHPLIHGFLVWWGRSLSGFLLRVFPHILHTMRDVWEDSASGSTTSFEVLLN